jgi:hypothetical protein
MTVYESSWPVGPNIVTARPEEVMAAMATLPDTLAWETLAARVVPLFERVRPYPPGLPDPLKVVLPPGLRVGFGVDLGPAFVTVSQEMVAGWPVSAADVAARALANLHSLASVVRPDMVILGPIGDLDTAWLQTELGIGSVLTLAPSELGRLFGEQPRCFIAPMRDLLIGLPAGVDPYEAAWLYAEIASQDPNCLHPRLFSFDGQRVAGVEPLPIELG